MLHEFEFNVSLIHTLQHTPDRGDQKRRQEYRTFSLFAEMLRAVVFPETELHGKPGDLQRTARWCLWRLTECDMMGASPIALVGYLSIVEVIAAKLLYNGRVDNPIGPNINRQLDLGSEAAAILEHLFDRRNYAVHKIDCRVGLDEIRASWRLAKAATVFIMTLATIGGDNIGSGEYIRKQLTDSFECAVSPGFYESMQEDDSE